MKLKLEIENKIIDNYIPHVTSLRAVADICNTDHHTVKRVLSKHNIPIFKGKTKRKFRALSEEHKKLIGCANTGKHRTKLSRYKNMATHLRFDVSYEWLSQFDDFDKLKILNRAITNRDKRYGDLSTKDYKKYIKKFYNCSQFNRIYFSWLTSGKMKYKKPSLDHIHPRARGGRNTLNNFQFLSWFENKCKFDMSQDEWNELKTNIDEYFI